MLAAGAGADFYALAALSLLAFYLYFPRYRRWEEWATERGIEFSDTREPSQ